MNLVVVSSSVVLYLAALLLILPGLLNKTGINAKGVLGLAFVALLLHFSTLVGTVFNPEQNLSILNVTSLVSS